MQLAITELATTSNIRIDRVAFLQCKNMVVGADPGSIPRKCKPANTRYDTAESCEKVLTPVTPSPSTTIFRIYPILPVGSIHSRIPNPSGQ